MPPASNKASATAPANAVAPFTVAIIGSGIIGTVLALGLSTRSIPVKVYEQSRSHREIGAGIAFTANARRCLALIDPRLEDCVTAVATVNGDPAAPNNNMQFVDGFTHDPVLHRGVGEEMVGRKVWRLWAGERGFEGCHRAHFLEGVMGVLPEGVVEMGRRVEGVVCPEGEGKVRVVFSDGSFEEADIVIGCDGLKSRIRAHFYPPPNPIGQPHYTHKVAYRGLIPMPLAISTLGHSRATNQQMYGGPNAHVLHFPVARQTLLNVVAFVTDPTDWPLEQSMTQPAGGPGKEELRAAFASWGPTVRAIIDLLLVSGEGLDKWGVFDMFDFPAPAYSQGRVCVAGDAAHASSPHHGAGAGIGVEDGLALCVLLERARDELIHNESEGQGQGQGQGRADAGGKKRGKAEILEKALQVFSDVRLERSQWLVRSSREVCETYEWVNAACGRDMERGFEDVKARSHRIWDFDIEGMVGELGRGFESDS
ncbi:hypothetical protein BJX99DRAFT_265208 [Aspergillus californicus]